MFNAFGKEIRKGVTLAELLVVCAMLAILACTIVPVIFRAREKSRLALCSQRIQRVGKAAIQFETNGITTSMESYFSGLVPMKHVLPWRTLRAIQLREGLPLEWADPLCVRKINLFVREKDNYTPISTVQGLGRLYPIYISRPETLYCPSSSIWTKKTGWSAGRDGCSYVSYCSREGAFKLPNGKLVFNTYSSKSMSAFISCASFMGYQGHSNGWNVWFTDGHVRFITDEQGILRDLKGIEWFDMPKDYPPVERWSIWVHFDKLYNDLEYDASGVTRAGK